MKFIKQKNEKTRGKRTEMKFKNQAFVLMSIVTLLGFSVSSAFAEEKANPINAGNVVGFEGFIDVREESFAYDSIIFLGAEGIIKGYGNGLFGLKHNVTRGQVSALIIRYLKLDTDKEFDNPYTDVEGDMFEKEVLAVTNEGYMQGKGNDKFDPTGILSRAEMAQVLTNVFGLEVKKEEDFWDMNEDDWSIDAVRALYSNGLTLGVGDNKFNPKENVSREQYAEFLYRGIHLDEGYEAEPIPPKEDQEKGENKKPSDKKPSTGFDKSSIINQLQNKGYAKNGDGSGAHYAFSPYLLQVRVYFRSQTEIEVEVRDWLVEGKEDYAYEIPGKVAAATQVLFPKEHSKVYAEIKSYMEQHKMNSFTLQADGKSASFRRSGPSLMITIK